MLPVAIIITGASRGFGRALAIVAASAFAPTNDDSSTHPVKLILVARSLEGLLETESLIREEDGHGSSAEVSCQAMDLGDLDRLDDHIDKICREIETMKPLVRRIILIQNAGTIGHLGRCRDSPSLKDMQANVDLNITSTLWISARMSRYAKASSTPLTIVNVSSLVAVDNFPTFGIYSAGKSARDKYHCILSKEEASTDDEDAAIRTLNYAPVSYSNGKCYERVGLTVMLTVVVVLALFLP